jgi:pimeloyl-ACP methyl ester carboxylesterase
VPHIQAGRSRIHFVELGPAPTGRLSPVVFIHGAGGSHQIWFHQLKGLGGRRKVIALDLPGHGDSNGSGADRIEGYRDLLKEFLAERGLHRTVLVGHSMGGAITQSFALAYPDRLAAIVLVGTGARLRVHPKIFAGLRDDPAGAVGIITRSARAPDASPEEIEQDAEAMLRTPVEVIERDLRACDAFDLMEQVKEIMTPALVICGTADLMTPPKYAEYLHQHITGSELAFISGAGHMVMLEKPDEVNRAIDAFLDRLSAETTSPN